MNPFRLLVFATKFWPLVDDSSMRLMHWASTLLSHGVDVRILTPRWNNAWPATAECREVLVERLLPPPKSNWSQTHFLRALGRWVQLNRSRFDAIYVDQPNSVLHFLGNHRSQHGLPVLARYHQADLNSADLAGHALQLSVAIESCRKANWVIVPDAQSDRRLRSEGILGDSIRRIIDADWIGMKRDVSQKLGALRALAKISSDLMVPKGHRIILVMGNIHRRAGLEGFCRTIGPLLDEGAKFQVWIVGTGEGQRSLYQLLKDQSWHREIMMQGAFDSIDDLLQVADLCVFPGEGWSLESYFPAVVASGTPWLAAKSTEASVMAGESASSLFFQPGDWNEFAGKLRAWNRDPAEIEKVSQQARHSFLTRVDSQQVIQEWLQLFRDVRLG